MQVCGKKGGMEGERGGWGGRRERESGKERGREERREREKERERENKISYKAMTETTIIQLANAFLCHNKRQPQPHADSILFTGPQHTHHD